MKTKQDKAIFWDYNFKKADMKNPKVKVWFLNRKLKFGDLSGVKKTDLKKYFSKLNINSSLKELLRNFLIRHA